MDNMIVLNSENYDETSKETSSDLGKDYDGFKEYLADIGSMQVVENEDDIPYPKGSKAWRDALVEKYLKLVLYVVKRYRYINNSVGMPLEDVIQEGNIGLMRAAEKYDPDLGYKFSTYAVPWIKQSIRRAFTQKGRIIRIPDHMVERMSKVQKARDEFYRTQGFYAPDDVIAKQLGLTEQAVEECDKYNADIDSLDREVDEENDTELMDLIADNSVQGPDVVCLRNELRQTVREVMANKLSPKEIDILQKRMGFDEEKGVYTLDELGQMYGVTRERIRQIQNEAKETLRRDTQLNKYYKALTNYRDF